MAVMPSLTNREGTLGGPGGPGPLYSAKVKVNPPVQKPILLHVLALWSFLVPHSLVGFQKENLTYSSGATLVSW